MSRNTLRVLMTAQKSQKGQKGRKTNFKSRRRGRRAATPARLLPALRQTRPGCGVSPCFQDMGRDRPPAALRVLPWDVVQAVTLCALCAPLCGLSARGSITIAPHGLRPSWAALRGCEGIRTNRHKRTPAGCEPVRGFVRYNQRKRGRLWCFQ